MASELYSCKTELVLAIIDDSRYSGARTDIALHFTTFQKFFRAMLCRAQLCHSKWSVRPSV